MTRILCLTISIALLLIALPIAVSAEDGQSKLTFERRSEANRIIIFVHGFTGSSQDTWLHDRTEAFWPKLIADDPGFSDSDIAIYSYPSTLFEDSYSIDEIADNLRLRLQSAGVPRSYYEIVFVAHSMGGLVVRALMLKHRNIQPVPLVYFLATPTNGADLANIASLLSNNRQIQGLKSLEESLFLQSQSAQWLASPYKSQTRSYCAYETKTTLGIRVVSRESATALCNQRLDPIAENHIRIVKPANEQSDAYVAFKVAYEETFQRLELVGNGVDVTLEEEKVVRERVITADRLRIVGDVMLQNDALIVANDIVLDEGSLSGRNLSILAGSVTGGTVDVSGREGQNGGELLIAAGRVVGTRIIARGSRGSAGQNGADGSNGHPGSDGQNGDCSGFGGWKAAHAGGDGSAGADGTDGEDGGDGGNGGQVFLVTLNEFRGQYDVSGGEEGRGGAGGRGGQGGKGGRGGSGCTGLGGSQASRSSGVDGINGHDGRSGADGSKGAAGVVWARQVESFSEIASLVPTKEEIVDYAGDIVEQLKITARGRNATTE